MPLRKFQTIRFFQPPQPVPVDPAPAPPVDSSILEVRSLWRTGLLLATSAAFGGIAVAIWNRRALAQMRQQVDSVPPATQNRNEAE